MAFQTIGLDWDEIQGYMVTLENSVVTMLDNIKKTASLIENMNATPGGEDITVTSVVNKLNTLTGMMKDSPALVQDLAQTLKQKSVELDEATRSSVAGIENA